MVKFYFSLFIFPIFLLAVRGIEGQAQVAPLPTDTFRTVVLDSIRLDDEIAVGYATGNQRTMSGSVDKVSEKRMNKGFVSSSLNALSGQAAGVSISTGANRAAALSAVRVRGTTSLDRRERPAGHYRWGFSSDLNTLSSLSGPYREFHYPERCFRDGTVRFAWCFGGDRGGDEERERRCFQYQLRWQFRGGGCL